MTLLRLARHRPKLWSPGRPIVIATNNGEIGGGEVMLLNIAAALQRAGREPLVLGPSKPSALVDEARTRGFRTVALSADTRLRYMMGLAMWRIRNLNVALWCNGLVPSAATAGMGSRVVHLHLLPVGVNRIAAAVARPFAERVLTCSRFMATQISGGQAFPNWIQWLPYRPDGDREVLPTKSTSTLRVGFLGRMTRDKGVDVLGKAMQLVIPRFAADDLDVRLVVAGENRFGSPSDDRAITEAFQPIEDHIDHLGWVDPEVFFSQIDVAVFPSVFPEPFGLVAVEAMASGVPFVVSDAGGLPEVVGDNYELVVRAGEVDSLADKIGTALQNLGTPSDIARRSRMRQRYRNEFSPEAGDSRVRKLLASLSQELVGNETSAKPGIETEPTPSATPPHRRGK